MRVYISVDIEGATGIASFAQCGRPDSAHYDFPFARRMLTGDVNAAVRGARAAGSDRIVIKDSHGTCKNLLIEELEPGVELISGWGAGKLGMMEGVDGGFDAAMLVGYHAMAGTPGMMEHALVGGMHRFRINGRQTGEIAVSAALAGAFGVPTVLVTSDRTGCDEAVDWLPDVSVYATKFGLGHSMGRLLSPSVTWPAIEAAAKEAVSKAPNVKPFRFEGPVTMTAEFRTSLETDLAATLVGVKRLDAYTIEWSAPDYLAAHHLAANVFSISIQGRRSGD